MLLGSSNGQLWMYAATENGNKDVEFQLLLHDENFSSKPIIQIGVISKHALLLSLTNGVIGIHKITDYSFEPVHTCDNTKGASSFTFNHKQRTAGNNTFGIRICVVINERIQFHHLKQNKLPQCHATIFLVDKPINILWVGDLICIAFSTTYAIYDVSITIPIFIYQKCVCN